MEKEICPKCGKKELEKIPPTPGMEWLERPDLREWWGCPNCGEAFFKKVLNKCEKGSVYNENYQKGNP